MTVLALIRHYLHSEHIATSNKMAPLNGSNVDEQTSYSPYILPMKRLYTPSKKTIETTRRMHEMFENHPGYVGFALDPPATMDPNAKTADLVLLFDSSEMRSDTGTYDFKEIRGLAEDFTKAANILGNAKVKVPAHLYSSPWISIGHTGDANCRYSLDVNPEAVPIEYFQPSSYHRLVAYIGEIFGLVTGDKIGRYRRFWGSTIEMLPETEKFVDSLVKELVFRDIMCNPWREKVDDQEKHEMFRHARYKLWHRRLGLIMQNSS